MFDDTSSARGRLTRRYVAMRTRRLLAGERFPLILSLLSVLSLLPSLALGCSPIAGAPVPAQPTREQHHSAADLVVSGTVIKTASSGDFAVKVWFKVEEVVKGQAGEEIVFTIALPSSDCPELQGHFPVGVGEGRQLLFLKLSESPAETALYAIRAESQPR
jgi:hypothetical protein